MLYIFISTIAFTCLLISDIIQISRKKYIIIPLSILGYLGVFFTLLVMTLDYPLFPVPLYILTIKFALVLIFLILLVYVLFAEIPFSSQYRQNDERTVINYGSYGIVRHPGFHCFLLLIGALNLLPLQLEYLLISLYIILLNFMLILIEDLILFPKIFKNYHSYKLKVPFLIPRLQSK